MNKAFAMAGITFLQGFRAQSFRIVAALFISFFGIAYSLRVLSIGHKEQMLRSIGLSAMEISALLLVVFGCIAGYYREKESRLRAIHLSYVSFLDHVAGRFIGNCLLMATYLALGTIASALVLLNESSWHWYYLLGVYSVFLKLSIICSFCALFSYLFRSPVFSSLTTVFIYFSSEYASYPLTMIRRSPSAVPEGISRFLYHILPNFDKIDLKYPAIIGSEVALSQILMVTVYSVSYLAMILLLAWAVLSRNEH